jgi:hypothetical protein
MNDFSDEVHVYLDVFVVVMLNWIFGKLDGTLIVSPKGIQMLLLEDKL